ENHKAYVIARTTGSSRNYFFREFRDAAWKPWTHVKIDCEDMPVVPIVWNGRLFLFWLKAIKQPPQAGFSLPVPDDTTMLGTLQVKALRDNIASSNASALSKTMNVQVTLAWSEYYNGKWQTVNTTNANTPSIMVTNIAMGQFDTDRNRWMLINASRALNVADG